MPTNFMAIDQGLPRFTGSESLEQRVKMLQDYQYQLVEQLRYALQNLDTRNMNMDAMGEWGGTLTEPLYASLMDEDGNMLSLAATAKGLSAQISDQNGKIAQISADAAGLSARLWDTETGAITQLQAKAGELSASVTELATGQTKMVTFDAQNGLMVYDADGNAVQVDGTKVVAGELIGKTVKLSDGKKVIGEFELYDAGISWYGKLYGMRWRAGFADIIAADGFEVSVGSDEYDDSTNWVTVDLDETVVGEKIVPYEDETYDLGKSSRSWNNVYASTCECCTSDRNKKNSIDYDLDAYERVFDALKPVSYKLNNGTSGRTHIGMIAQDVEETLCVCGMTGTDFAGLIKSPKNDGNGNVIEGEYVYGLRYGEFIGLLIDQVQKLKSRVAELERSKA